MGNVIRLHPAQATVFNSNARFRVVVAGRRLGKTMHSMVELIRAAKKPKQLVMYAAPTFTQARGLVWEPLKEMIPKKWIAGSHETRLELRLINGTVIMLRGAENREALRGVGLHFLVMDEVEDIDRAAWYEILRPTLATTRGRALFIGSPKGYRLLYDLYLLGQDPNNPDWESWQFMTKDSPFVSYQELESARRDLSPKQYAQEFEAQFLSSSNRVYSEFNKEIHIRDREFNPNSPILIGFDFNIAPMSLSVAQKINDNDGLHIVDEIVLYDSNVVEACDAIEAKYWRWIDNCFIYPDASGINKGHARGESSFQILAERGFKNVRAYRKNPPVVDRVNCVNRLLMNAAGEPRLFFNKRCIRTIQSFEQTTYREGSNDIDKKPGVEHSADSVGYICAYEFPVRKYTLTGISV